MNRLIFALPLLPVLSCANGSSAAPPSAQSPILHRTLQLDLPSADGALVSIPLANRTTVVDAWSPACVPCRASVPALVARSAELEAANAKLVLVAVLAEGESTEAAQKALASWGVERPFLVDRGDVLRREASVDKLPATLVVSPRGEVMWVAPSNANADDVVKAARSGR